MLSFSKLKLLGHKQQSNQATKSRSMIKWKKYLSFWTFLITVIAAGSVATAILAPSQLPVLSSLLVPVIAVLGVYIAYQQSETAKHVARIERQKLRLSLFDRRFAVFEASRDFLIKIVIDGKIDDTAIAEFMIKTQETQWLLDKKLEDYLRTTLYQKAIRIQTIDMTLKGLGKGKERTELSHERGELMNWMINQMQILRYQFSTFMRIRIR